MSIVNNDMQKKSNYQGCY